MFNLYLIPSMMEIAEDFKRDVTYCGVYISAVSRPCPPPPPSVCLFASTTCHEILLILLLTEMFTDWHVNYCRFIVQPQVLWTRRRDRQAFM